MLLAGLCGFITGAGMGIGRAIALEMVREGVDLYITDLDVEAAEHVAAEAQVLRPEAHMGAGQLDVRDATGAMARLKDAVDLLGGLELAVNNAGVSSMGKVVDLTEADWDFNIHVPPYATGLDIAPLLDETLKPIVSAGEVVSGPVGSKAVRAAIERYQPLVSLHGHVHESRAVTRLGRTTCINPGSEYADGNLRAALVNIRGDKLLSYQLITG
jgi:NAD(P)-dependent dehydrogenase (short-subunit alcohol dehydrogenase family)